MAIIVIGDDGRIVDPFDGKLYIQTSDVGGSMVIPNIDDKMDKLSKVNDSFPLYREAVKTVLGAIPENGTSGTNDP